MGLQVDIKKKLKNFQLAVAFDTDASGQGKTCISGILGASGCGKSMTLKCIAGIETPDSGKIVLNGRVLFDSEKKINVKVQDRHVGYLFQSYALFPNMTVEENIRMGAQRNKEQKLDLDYYMELFHIKEIRDSYPQRLSGGQQQRVALARMLASDPEVLMLDEPFSALDSYLKEKLQLELLEVLNSYNKDILMVTHSRDEVYRFCNSIYILEEGNIVASGNTKEVFRNPLTVAAAKLTGCKNIINTEVIDKHTLYLQQWDVTLKLQKEIPADTSAVGIRAHYLRETMQTENNVACRNGRVMEDPFEVVVIFENDIWWKLSKNEYHKKYEGRLPERLEIPEEALLFLK